MSDWQEERLDAHLTRITYGFTNPMPTTDVGPYMVTARDVNDGRILYEQARRTSFDAYRNELTDKSRPEIGDVLVTKDGTLGRIAVVDRDDICINQSVALLKPAQTIRSRFLKYLLEEPRNHSRMLGDADGTTIKHIYVTRLAKMPVRVPTLRIQDKILDALGSLDDKIELNRRGNETLEAIAQAIFRDWFVDFGPTRRRQDGATGPFEIMGGLVSDPDRTRVLADLFPARLGEDGLPEGWGQRSVYDVSRVVFGAPFSSKRFNTDAVGRPLARIRDLKDHAGGVFTDEQHAREHLIQSGDIVVGMDGEFRAHLWQGDPTLMNQRVCSFVPVPSQNRAFLLFSIQPILSRYEASAVGTTVIHLGKRDIDQFKVVEPQAAVERAFSQLAEPLLDRLVANGRQARTLAATRDLLLPKLMTGEVRLTDAEVVLEAAQ